MLIDQDIVFLYNRAGLQTGLSTTADVISVTGRWYHVVAVLNGVNDYIYIDGVERARDAGMFPETTTTVLSIGSEPGGFNFFNGLIDEVRIYNRALSAAEIRAIFNATR